MTTADRRPAAASSGAPPRGADLVGRALPALCALSTAAAFADCATRVAAAPAEWALTEFWRTWRRPPTVGPQGTVTRIVTRGAGP